MWRLRYVALRYVATSTGDTFTHGWYFWPSLGTVAPMDEGTILVYCCPCTFSLTSSPLPKLNVQYIQTVCGCGGGGWGCCCRPYSAGVSHSVSDQIQNLQYCFSTPNKLPINNIKGLVSLMYSYSVPSYHVPQWKFAPLQAWLANRWQLFQRLANTLHAQCEAWLGLYLARKCQHSICKGMRFKFAA